MGISAGPEVPQEKILATDPGAHQAVREIRVDFQPLQNRPDPRACLIQGLSVDLEAADAVLEGHSRQGGSGPSQRSDQRSDRWQEEGSIAYTRVQQTGVGEVRGIRPADAPEHRPGCGILGEDPAALVELFDLSVASSLTAGRNARGLESAFAEHAGDHPA